PTEISVRATTSATRALGRVMRLRRGRTELGSVIAARLQPGTARGRRRRSNAGTRAREIQRRGSVLGRAGFDDVLDADRLQTVDGDLRRHREVAVLEHVGLALLAEHVLEELAAQR